MTPPTPPVPLALAVLGDTTLSAGCLFLQGAGQTVQKESQQQQDRTPLQGEDGQRLVQPAASLPCCCCLATRAADKGDQASYAFSQ